MNILVCFADAKDVGCLGCVALCVACCFLAGSVVAAPVYTVKQGDTLWGIAKAHKMSYERLCKIAGQQFYLGWHAGYEARRIVTDVRRFAEEVDISFAGERAWEKIGDDGRARMLKNDFEPKVSITDAVASVSYYVFSSFGGLFHVVDEVDMNTGKVRPRHIKFDNVIEYNCGVRY